MLKGGATVLFRWRPLKSSVEGETCRVAVFPGEDFLEKPEDLSDCELDTRVEVLVVPDVTDVLVSLSSVVTEFCDDFSCYFDGNWWNRSHLFPQSEPQVKVPP